MTTNSFLIVLCVNTIIAFCLWVCMRYDREQMQTMTKTKLNRTNNVLSKKTLKKLDNLSKLVILYTSSSEELTTSNYRPYHGY